VTSKIDSRTILGEQGGEQLLGQGDMLFMAGGGRIRRIHGPYVSDTEVEDVVKHLKSQGHPEYVEAVTAEPDEEDGEVAALLDGEEGGSGDRMYDEACSVVLRDRKVSTSYIQRRLQVGYNRAARIIERMEEEGLVSAPNHQGKREILVEDGVG
jgi:DNA segregation ATPase FtsK/SpoIIIE, S-DNA-T family